MKRQCTETENRIIKECGAYSLARPDTYKSMYKSNFGFFALGLLYGLVIGAVIVYFSGITNVLLALLIFTICISGMGMLLELIWLMFGVNKKIKKYLPGEKYWINGGTVIDYIQNKEGAYLIFTEDGLKDDIGNICSVEFPAYRIKSKKLNIRMF